MKNWKSILLCLSGLVPSILVAQEAVLSDLWRDPEFVDRFTSTFLPLTNQEPSVTEKEAELFQELATFLDAGQTAQALQRMERAVLNASDPASVNAALNYTLGNLYLQAARFEDAAGQYAVAIEKFPNFRRAYKNLGLAELQGGNFKEAIKALVKAIELGDAGGDTFGLLGYSYLNDGNPVAALEGYRQASLLNPGNREWRIGKAEALMRTQRYEEAIAEFKQLITEQPNRSAFYTSISNAYLSLNEADTAARYLEILRRQDEAKSSALGLLGDIYINEGLARLALGAYQDALEKDDFSTTRGIRALRALLMRGHYPEADTFLADLEARLGAQFDEAENREILNLKAQLALAEGQDDEAARILEEVLEQDPMNANALMLLGDYNQEREDLENAIYYYRRALTIPDVQRNAQLQLARVYVQQKEYLEAIRQLEAALQLEYSANVQDFLDSVRAVYSRSL